MKTTVDIQLSPLHEEGFQKLVKILPKAQFHVHLSKLSRETGVPISTLHDWWKRYKDRLEIVIKVPE